MEMKKRIGDPFMPPHQYGHQLSGLSINLLVRDVQVACLFAQEVLGATIVYSDEDFAVIKGKDSEWMVHADHTYLDHPLTGSLASGDVRGIGAELRLHGVDPDVAEAKARALGYTILAGSIDKPHGLRECYIIDADGYLWVPDRPIGVDE
jgi:catechol 2,3-dioxygenase-like lactoylglutathione lyase family enzyme